jgi:hypothetical protein
MGSAVKSVLGGVNKTFASPIQSIIDPIRGKVDVAPQYNPDSTAYRNSAAQQAYQDQLRKQALGQDPTSIAQQQFQQASNANIAQIAGKAAGERRNQALGLREAFRAQANANQQAAAQSGLLRAQEMQAAQAAYGNDLTRQQTALQNEQALKSGIAGATQQLQTGANLNQQQTTQKLFQDLAGAGAKAAGSSQSDKNVKKDIKELNPKDIEEFATKLKASKFKYKQPNGESYQDGEVTGIMAQDLEKSKIGKEMVFDSPEGKMVDFKRAVPATLAAVSEVMKRIKKLESEKKSKKEEE